MRSQARQQPDRSQGHTARAPQRPRVGASPTERDDGVDREQFSLQARHEPSGSLLDPDVAPGSLAPDAATPVQARRVASGYEDIVEAADAGARSPVQAKCAACETEQPVQARCAAREAEQPVQARCAACDAEQTDSQPVQLWDCSEYGAPTCVQNQLDADAAPVQRACSACDAEVQAEGAGPASAREPRSVVRDARRALRDADEPLPHAAKIQAAFGRHDVSQVRAVVGGAAEPASQRMGALAFTSGDRIGFRTTPDLRLAAHEAAHTIQQRGGLTLPGDVGRAGDAWERHADAVADAVVRGQSAEPLLDAVARPAAAPVESPEPPASTAAPVESPASTAAPVQRQITSAAYRLLEAPTALPMLPAPAAKDGAEPGAPVEGDDRKAKVAEGSALAAAEAGADAAQPAGAAAGATAGATAAAGAAPPPGPQGQPAAPAGGGAVEPTCYTAASPPKPADAAKPAADNRGSHSEADAKVTYAAWSDAPDNCTAEQDISAGAQQMPAGIGSGAAPGAAAATPDAAPTAQPAAPAPAEDQPAPAPGRGASPAPAGAPAPAVDESAAPTSALDGAIAAAESQRNTAVTDYDIAAASLGARADPADLPITFTGAGSRPGASDAAAAQVRAFFARMSGSIAGAVAFVRDQVPARLGGAAEATKANIQAAMEVEKAAISGRVAQARGAALAGAAAARATIEAQYAGSVAVVDAETLAAVATLDTEHSTSLDAVDRKETTSLDDLTARFAAGRLQHEQKGPEYARKALARGQEYVARYEGCKGDYSDDGVWDGCLTVRRARAQQDAACKTAAGYKDAFLQTANKSGFELGKLRTQFRCAVIAGARSVNKTLDDTHEQLVAGLQSGRRQALAALALARRQNLAAVTDALAATLRTLSAQATAQRQAINDTGYLKQLAAEQLAHASAANLARGVAAAMDSLDGALASLRDRFAAGEPPEPDALTAALAGIEASLGAGMGTLLGKMEEGAGAAEALLVESGAAALAALYAVTAKNDELAATVEQAFDQQTRTLVAAAGSSFDALRTNHVDQTRQARTEGVASMKRAVSSFDDAVATVGGHVDTALRTSLDQLEQQLRQKLSELDAQIVAAATEAARREQPAWKSVVAIVLVILVIIAAAVISIVTLGAGAGVFAVILVGALVGAVSGGLIQIINNWASGAAWDEGLVQAMVMGAIGGAIGGGLGFAAGAISAAARPLAQFAITVGADLVSEGLTQTVGYFAFGQQFNWQGFLMAGAMSSISFRPRTGSPHAPGPHAGTPDAPHARPATPDAPAAPHGPATPTVAAPHAPTPKPSRASAVTQVAAGATVGIGVEYLTSLLSGEKFDLTRAASAAASGGVGARMAHGGGHPTDATTPPKTGAGGALDRFRSFDPGGIGARIEKGLNNFGQRTFGGHAGGEPPPTTRSQPAPDETGKPRPTSTEAPSTARPHENAEVVPGRAHEDAPNGRPLKDTDTPSTHPTEAPKPAPHGESPPAKSTTGDRPKEAPGTILHEMSGEIGGQHHTVRAVEGSNGAVLTICSQCTKLLNHLAEAQKLPHLNDEMRARIVEMEVRVKAFEAYLSKKSMDVPTLKELVGILAELDLLTTPPKPPSIKAAPPPGTDVPRAIGTRADTLQSQIEQKLTQQFRDMFPGKTMKNDSKPLLKDAARARALTDAQAEILGSPLALRPGERARTVVNPTQDYPMGFHSRADFDAFALQLHQTIKAHPDLPAGIQLVLEGSGVTGRRFDRLVSNEPTGAPFNVGRLSDYDVAIISPELVARAKSLKIPLNEKNGAPRTKPLGPEELKLLKLEGLAEAAKKAALQRTGIPQPVNFKLYDGTGLDPNRPHLDVL